MLGEVADNTNATAQSASEDNLNYISITWRPLNPFSKK